MASLLNLFASPLIVLMRGSDSVGQGQASGGTARAVSEVGLSREGEREAIPVVAAVPLAQ